jgi:radical SAM superfamily enzyme YgiQ (UPF0313 family)
MQGKGVNSHLPRETTGNTDIAFIVSPANAKSEYMPFYFLYLAGYIEKFGFRSVIIDHHLPEEECIQAILGDVRRLKPRWVGFAAFVTDYEMIVSLATRVKEATGTTIIVGNAQASLCPGDFLYPGSPFDVVIRGEGEITLRELLEQGAKGEPMHATRGIAFFDGTKVMINPSREIMDLKDCGFPAYHQLDMDWYSRPTKYIIRRIPASCAVIYTGRGCPFKCSFCAANTVWDVNDCPPGRSFVRKRPLTDVLRELEILEKQYRFDFFYILDDTFGLNREDLIEFCNAYRESGLSMLWGAETRVNCVLDPGLIRLLAGSGCIQLDFGVETGSPRLLRAIRKGITVDQVAQAFSLCREGGIRTLANIMVNLPGETVEDLALTEQLLDRIRPTTVSIGATQPYPGTELYRTCLKNAIPREDYRKLSRLVPPEEFRMAAHHLSLQDLLYRWQFRFGVYVPVEYGVLKTDRRYWKKILSSGRRLQYILYFLKMILVVPALEYGYMWMKYRLNR